VQAFTHPLWMLLHIPFYALWENIFWITTILSVVCVLTALAVTLGTFRRSWQQGLALLIIPFGVSSTLSASSMIGLENPLTHLLFALFGWSLFREGEKYFWFWITLYCAPVMAWLAARQWRSVRWKQCLLGSLPIIAWEIFSVIYYGFLLPNTAYAKLPGGMLDIDSLHQGLRYVLNLMALDPTSAAFMVAVPLLLGYRWLRRRPADPRIIALACGVWCYIFYVIDVGGTYIAERLLSLPVFASLWIIYGMAKPPAFKGRPWLWLLGELLLAIRLFYPSIDTLKTVCPPCFAGDIAYKWFVVTVSGFPADPHTHKQEPLPHAGRDKGHWASAFSGIGFGAFTIGPGIFAINPFGFTDPLLARLPNTGASMSDSSLWHLLRPIPDGYVEAMQSGSMKKMDPSLAEYYGKLHLIIAGDLWSAKRWETIIRFNLGQYDYLRDDYVATHPVKK
jgi:arabinofuranosyltransferase